MTNSSLVETQTSFIKKESVLPNHFPHINYPFVVETGLKMDNETAIRLIEIYGFHSPLWDTRLKEYHNNNVREDLWVEIAKTFVQPKAALKLKMKSLLSSYRRQICKATFL